jgi:hypothetical protein
MGLPRGSATEILHRLVHAAFGASGPMFVQEPNVIDCWGWCPVAPLPM